MNSFNNLCYKIFLPLLFCACKYQNWSFSGCDLIKNLILGINLRPVVGISLIYLTFFFVSPYIPLRESRGAIRIVYLSSLLAVSTVFLAIQLIFQVKNVRDLLDLHTVVSYDVFGIVDFRKSRYEFLLLIVTCFIHLVS